MIKVFTVNKNNKIELTEQELKSLLDEAYWEGYHATYKYTYISPLTSPYVWTSTTTTYNGANNGDSNCVLKVTNAMGDNYTNEV